MLKVNGSTLKVNYLKNCNKQCSRDIIVVATIFAFAFAKKIISNIFSLIKHFELN